MRIPLPFLALAAIGLSGCVVAPRPAPPPVAMAPPGPVVVAPGPAAYNPAYNCYEERREAQAAQRFANRQRAEANYYGTPRQANQAWSAQRNADRERAQAARAC